MLLLLFFTNRETRSGFVFLIPVFFIITRPFNKHTYMYVHTSNVIKGAGATIGAGKKNSISPKGEFETIPGGSKNKVKATGATVCASTKNEALGDFSSIGSGNNNKAEGEYSMIPGGRNNKAKRKGSIVFGHNGNANHHNALIINIPLKSGKQTLKSTSAASFTVAANRFIFHIETTRVKITQANIGNIK